MNPTDTNQTQAEAILDRVLERVASVLTEQDMKIIETLDGADDEKGSMVENFLKAKVPNFDAIMKEEMDAYKASQKN